MTCYPSNRIIAVIHTGSAVLLNRVASLLYILHHFLIKFARGCVTVPKYLNYCRSTQNVFYASFVS